LAYAVPLKILFHPRQRTIAILARFVKHVGLPRQRACLDALDGLSCMEGSGDRPRTIRAENCPAGHGSRLITTRQGSRSSFVLGRVVAPPHQVGE
jgi:hypothetical protein